MMRALIQWSLNNRALVLAAAAGLLGFGAWSAIRMPVDVFPDLTAPTVTVITEAHGMAPIQVESQVTFPLETALNGAAGVRRVRSSTSVGLSVVWIEFEWGTNIRDARQIVSEKLPIVAAEIPPQVQRPIMAPISSIMGEVLFISLTSDRHSPMEVRSHVDTQVRRRLLSVPGVAQVTPIGGEVKQYQVALSEERLKAYGVGIDRVIEAVSNGNENVTAGILNQHGNEWLVTGQGRAETLGDIGATPVKATNGIPVQVKDLGKVQVGAAPKRGEASVNGEPAVVLGIQKQPGVNTLALTDRLDSVLNEIAESLPAGMTINRDLFRQADFIEVAIDNVVDALRDGAILVVVVILFFLVNLRATLISLLAIPLSLVVAVLTLNHFGSTINTMTLGGMAIAIGALVDDAIIVVENAFRRLRERATFPESQRPPTRQVVFRASVEILQSIVFATFIIALVFVPIFFLSGVEGRLLKPLGVAYVVSLLASLLVAITVTPVLCLLLLPGSRGITEGREPKVAHWLKSKYRRLLEPVLRHPWATTGPVLAAFLLAVIACFYMGRGFLPEFNEGSLTISAVTEPGTSLDRSDKMGRVVEETLLEFPEVVSVARRTGRAELSEHAQGVNAAELDVDLEMKDRSKERFLAALREELSKIPGMNIVIGQPIAHRIDHMLSGTRANIAVKIFGDDLYRLRSIARQARDAMTDIPGLVDLAVEQQADVPMLAVRFDRNAIARHGLSIDEVGHALESTRRGVTVSEIFEGRYSFDLVVRTGKRKEWRLETIGDLLIETPSGGEVPLRTLADIEKRTGPNTISREAVERKIVVMCNVAGRDVTSVVQDVQTEMQPILAENPGYRVEYGGRFESAQEANRRLLFLGLLVVLGIGLLLHLAFGRARDAMLVMLNLPLALLGGVIGVFVAGGILNVASVIGFITVFGIATRNGIMLVSHIRHLQSAQEVGHFREAVVRGAQERLIPIVMTALATGLALIPLALGGGEPGKEIQTPMAIVILFGLISSMILNMIIVPTLYLRFGKPVEFDRSQV